jgi:hypothetical protein
MSRPRLAKGWSRPSWVEYTQPDRDDRPDPPKPSNPPRPAPKPSRAPNSTGEQTHGNH